MLVWLEKDESAKLLAERKLAEEAAVAEAQRVADEEAAAAEAQRLADEAAADAQRQAEEQARQQYIPPAPAPAAPAPAAPAAPAPAPASAYYPNCSAARAAGAAPVRIGQPGYGSHLDRDGDGVGCEK